MQCLQRTKAANHWFHFSFSKRVLCIFLLTCGVSKPHTVLYLQIYKFFKLIYIHHTITSSIVLMIKMLRKISSSVFMQEVKIFFIEYSLNTIKHIVWIYTMSEQNKIFLRKLLSNVLLGRSYWCWEKKNRIGLKSILKEKLHSFWFG